MNQTTMKKVVLALAVSLFLATGASNCLLLNKIGLNPGHVSGAEAKDIIADRTLVNIAILVSRGDSTSAAIAYVTPTLAGINDSDYYKKADVTACADRIVILQFITVLGAPFLGCNIQPDNALIDP